MIIMVFCLSTGDFAGPSTVCFEIIVGFHDGYKSSSYKWIIINNPMKTSSIYRRQKPACDIGHTFAPTNRAHERNGNQPVLRWAMELVN